MTRTENPKWGCAAVEAGLNILVPTAWPGPTQLSRHIVSIVSTFEQLLVGHHSRIPPRIPCSRYWCRWHRTDNTRTAGTSCRPHPQVCGDGVDGTRSTAREPMVSPLYTTSSLGRCRARLAVRLAPSSFTIFGSRSASKSLHSYDNGAVLIKRAPPYRPLALTRRTPAKEDSHFTIPLGCLAPSQPSMDVLSCAGVTTRRNSTRRSACIMFS